MESWRTVFRNGFAPFLPIAGLEYVADLLRKDDPRLLQGATTKPPGLTANLDSECEAACFLGSCAIACDRQTVGEVGLFFADACWKADQLLGEPAACRWFLNWYDDTPRAAMRVELLAEVERALAERKVGAA